MAQSSLSAAFWAQQSTDQLACPISQQANEENTRHVSLTSAAKNTQGAGFNQTLQDRRLETESARKELETASENTNPLNCLMPTSHCSTRVLITAVQSDRRFSTDQFGFPSCLCLSGFPLQLSCCSNFHLSLPLPLLLLQSSCTKRACVFV